MTEKEEIIKLKEDIERLEKENRELDLEYERLVNFISKKYPSVACAYLEQKLTQSGATVIKL